MRIGSVLHDLHARGHETHNVQLVYVVQEARG